jgi:hypothetical protein
MLRSTKNIASQVRFTPERLSPTPARLGHSFALAHCGGAYDSSVEVYVPRVVRRDGRAVGNVACST